MRPRCAKQLEQEHVYGVYSELASSLSQATNDNAWPRVLDYLNSLPPDSLILDVGCGNGKYLSANQRLFMCGCDICEGLLQPVKQRIPHASLMVADNLQLPFRPDLFDGAISIGVIHHFATELRREKAIREMVRTLKTNGTLLIYVWAYEQKRQFSAQDVLIPWLGNAAEQNSCPNDLHTPEDSTMSNTSNSTEQNQAPEVRLEDVKIDDAPLGSPLLKKLHEWISLDSWRRTPNSVTSSPTKNPPMCQPPPPPPVSAQVTPISTPILAHRHRFNLVTNTISRVSPRLGHRLHSWLGPKVTLNDFAADAARNIVTQALAEFRTLSAIQKEESATIDSSKHRYYHVFKKGELDSLVSRIENVEIVKSYYDHANWCLILRKIQN